MKLDSWRFMIYSKYKGICQKCKRIQQDDEQCFDAHHVISRRDGGENTLENGTLLCRKCHRNEHSQVPERGKIITIRLSIEDHKQFKVYAAEQETSIQCITSKLITGYLDKQKNMRARRIKK